MQRNKLLQNCVTFAVWCNRHKVDPGTAAELLTLAKRAMAAGERYCNVNNDIVDKIRDRTERAFEEAACQAGFYTRWPGLFPVLVRDGQEIHLPPIV